MKRNKPLERRTPLGGQTPLERHSGLRQTNPERRARLRDEQFGPEAFQKWVRAQECVNCGAWPSDPAHVKSRGAGGKWRGNIISLCRECHSRQHTEGWGALTIDPAKEAEWMFAQWEERYGEE